uniref:HAT C-terminal dimerisation domain-containing protein n=1 Tax=Ananas comosus var. bracteatus TaxID=296719 RepID=A0A6V7NEI1_ANACO|nr:unnamed protein product [Ananas comosus var. bracteatus]
MGGGDEEHNSATRKVKRMRSNSHSGNPQIPPFRFPIAVSVNRDEGLSLARQEACGKAKSISFCLKFQMVEEMAPLRSTGFMDPGWEHGVPQDERKKKVKCNYCGKIGPEEVYIKMKENLEGYRSTRKRQLEEKEKEPTFDVHSNDDDDDDDDDDVENSIHYKRKLRKEVNDQSLATVITPLRSLGYVDPGWEHGVAQDEKKKKLLDKVVEEVGEANVVQVITENSSYYRAAGKMLEEKRRSLFWMPSAADCIDQILGDFAEIKWLARSKASLKKLFQSSKWVSSQLSESDAGKEVEKIVLNPTFWKKIQYVKKTVDPVLQILKKAESNEGLSMPSIYNDMYRAKLSIKAVHGDDEKKYGPFLVVIDSHWNAVFNHPLYVAAYFLNPSFRYRPDFMALPEVIRGLNECITRLESDNVRRVSAASQISDFVFAKADFGTDLALSTRMELDPAAWWQQHGINCLELQRIAIRILSQTCTSRGSEHHWSAFDQIHTTRRNRIAQKRLKDLTYTHYNLRLREWQFNRTDNCSISLDNALLERLLESWVVEIDKAASPGGEETLYNETEQEPYLKEVNENMHLDATSRKPHTSSIPLPEVVESLEVHPASMATASDEDGGDLNFLDDDLSD